MGTIITIDIPAVGTVDAMERAFRWFRQVERCCSRFDPQSDFFN
jgi:hypothetical protein